MANIVLLNGTFANPQPKGISVQDLTLWTNDGDSLLALGVIGATFRELNKNRDDAVALLGHLRFDLKSSSTMSVLNAFEADTGFNYVARSLTSVGVHYWRDWLNNFEAYEKENAQWLASPQGRVHTVNNTVVRG